MNEETNNDQLEIASSLVNNVEEDIKNNKEIDENKNINNEKEQKFFSKYKIKDIVFLAIMSACTLCTGAIMPLLVNIPVIGIIQLGLALQFSIFPIIGIMKVRKPGALFLQGLLISCVLVFMFPPMVCIVLCALIAELVSLIFKGFKTDMGCIVASTLYLPLTYPMLFFYYNVMYSPSGNEKSAVSLFIGNNNPLLIILMGIAIVALSFIGSIIGMIISKELKKAGVIK